MTQLAKALAERIISQVGTATSSESHREVRLIFLGPPHELMSRVFDYLIKQSRGFAPELPFLLQVSTEKLKEGNPPVGESGWCDEGHLLDLRNLPSSASFVALIPPGEHSILSVGSTTDKFGVAERNNRSNATFEAWWEDSFVQDLVRQALFEAKLSPPEIDEALQLVEVAARAADEAESAALPREGAWRLVSRLFAMSSNNSIPPGVAVSLACGFPPTRKGSISAREQIATLRAIADVMSEGFGRTIERLSDGANSEDTGALSGFLDHVRSACEVSTQFDRATPAYYRPTATLELPQIPVWWAVLDVEKWNELLAEEPISAGDISVTCTNSLADLGKATPAIVLDEVCLRISSRSENDTSNQIEVTRTPAMGSGNIAAVPVNSEEDVSDNTPPSHKTALTYKATHPDFKSGQIKVFSLAHWAPGVLITCRNARKFGAPKKPSKRGARSSADWEASLDLPGSGRYEFLVFAASEVTLDGIAQLTSEEGDEQGTSTSPIELRQADASMYRAEVEADGSCQLDVSFTRIDANGRTQRQVCRTFITCQEATEGGHKSVFERLIKANRRQLESFDPTTNIPVNRAVRSTMLQDWIMSPDTVRLSYQPIVLAEDYGDLWAPPTWSVGCGPVLSSGSFIRDPRPAPAEFDPPADFLAAREEIARYVRGPDQSGVAETARLGEWARLDEQFSSVVERYVEAYQAWVQAAPDIACWSDVIAVCSLDSSGRSLAREPTAIILTPLHPLRIGWQVVAQQLLIDAEESGQPCPAASVLDPDCIPDILTLHVRSPAGVDALEYLAVENGTDYWSVLWNGRELEKLPERSATAPFGPTFGISVGGLSMGFSAAQVIRALDDVSDLLAAKPMVAVAVSSGGGATDACNQGLVEWCTGRFQSDDGKSRNQNVGPRFLEVYDDRDGDMRPDDATISNLSEDTGNSVRWYFNQPDGAVPDLGIIAQLNTSEPKASRVERSTPISLGGMIRHRVRRQLPNAFLSESRQSTAPEPTDNVLADKVATLITAIENQSQLKIGLQFAPNVHAIQHMLTERRTDFVAVSSAAVDPACFLGGWLEGAYLWDFDLPSYSHRAGDTNGYYLLSRVTDADRDALAQALTRLPGCESLKSDALQDLLLEISRRGIPTIKGLSGDDAGATGDLGIFVGARLLQDRFRASKDGPPGLLPVISGTEDNTQITIVVPVDPFHGYISDLRGSLGKDKGELTQLRPDLVIIAISLSGGDVRVKITPVEVKCRPTTTFSNNDAVEALEQAKALSELFAAMHRPGELPTLWGLAYQHLLLSIIGFGLRVYSQHSDVVDTALWSHFHERIAKAIFDSADCVEIDRRGRLIIVDASTSSRAVDSDRDGFQETIVIGREDASRVVAGDPKPFYDAIEASLGKWDLLPQSSNSTVKIDNIGETGSANEPELVNENDREVLPEPGPTVPKVASHTMQPETHSTPTSESPSRGVVLRVGDTIGGFTTRHLELNISDTRLNQLNVGVVGDLGTGKTQLLKSLITQIATSGPENRGTAPRFLIFDYKRDYSSPDFVAATGARVIRPRHIPLNFFESQGGSDPQLQWLDRFRFFADVLGKIYSGIGTVQREKLKRAVKEAYGNARRGASPTLRDVYTAYDAIVDGKPDSPMAIIGDMLDMEMFEEDQSRIVPFDKFLDGVVVIALDALGQDDHSKNMLVAIMLNMFYENMLKVEKKPFIGSDPQLRAIASYLLVDEADNIMRYEFDVLRKLLLQGREFGTGIILASQYLRHFKAGGTDYREPLLSWFIHKVPNVTAAELSALGLPGSPAEMAERIKGLGNHQCLYKSFDTPGEFIRGLPFFELVKDGSSLKS